MYEVDISDGVTSCEVRRRFDHISDARPLNASRLAHSTSRRHQCTTMPNTRSSNKDADFKGYYPQSVPKQIHFPHRRKTVRRPTHDVQDKRQMTFLPAMMRRQTTVQDSEAEDSEDDEVVRPTLKRKRKSDAPKYREATGVMKAEDDDEQSFKPQDNEPVENAKRKRRRQSTMTQIVDGRRPAPGDTDPDFRPVKSRRTSSRQGNKGAEEEARRQRTLTQMVPGLGSFGIVSDEDVAEDLEDSGSEQRESQEYHDAFARGLAHEGLLRMGGDNVVPAIEQPVVKHRHRRQSQGSGSQDGASTITRHAAIHDVHIKDERSGNEGEERSALYGGTLGTKKTRTSLRASTRRDQSPLVAKYTTSSTRSSTKSRFGLLSTPEKRKVFEIPSSQSPSGSPISTPVTPRRPGRSPLKPRSGNLVNTAETPSKRRKQVTFQEPDMEQITQPPSLRKFRSIVQDSEDEDEAMSEDDGPVDGEKDYGTETQASNHSIDGPLPGPDVGPETQAIIHSIDRACAHTEENAARANRESSEEPNELLIHRNNKESQELGEHRSISKDRTDVNPDDGIFRHPFDHAGVKQEPTEVAHSVETHLTSSPPSHQTPQVESSEDIGVGLANVTLPPQADDLYPSTPRQQQTQQHEEPPSTRMIIGDDSSDEDADEEEPISSPLQSSSMPRSHSPTNPPPKAPNATEQSVQVPRSPSSHPETQLSYSSKAEQQLHSEYQTYSQYRLDPLASSMYVVADPGFSYQATPFPARHTTQQVQHSGHISQATTIDPTQSSPCTTPRKPKSQPTRSTTTTPQKIPSSMPFVSPTEPPPLLIPSSYPSPGKVMAGWSSPMMGRSSLVAGRGCGEKSESQWAGNASWEDFSIPAPPPPLEVSDDEDL